jgi:hypothetical protein
LSNEDKHNYCIARREYKNLLKRKKKQFNDDLLNQLLNSISSQKDFWKSMKSLSCKQMQPLNAITIEDWFVYFKSLLEKEVNDMGDMFQDQNDFDNMYFNRPISREEIQLALKKLKNKKAAGPDGIVAEFLKNACKSQMVMDYFVKFFNSLFNKGIFPEKWTESIVLPLYKKGDSNNPNNYRGISLSDASSKLYSAVINMRLQEWVEENNITGEFQAGFKRNYSTIDHMYALMAFVQKQFCLNRKLYVAFIDFEKAFDSVNRSLLWPILVKYGICGKLLNCIMSMYKNVKARVRKGCSLTEYINCTTGVKQGDISSPILFSLFINELTLNVINSGRHGVVLPNDFLEIFILLLADDVVLISETIVGLQTQLNSLHRASVSLELKVNMNKSNIVVFRKGEYLAARERWTYVGHVMPVVNAYKYLGIYFSTRLSFTFACKDLVSRGMRALVCIMKKLYMLNNDSFSLFIKIFDCQIQPMLQYGSEIWGLEESAIHIEKLHLFALKKFLGVSKQTPNDLVYSETNRYPIHICSAVRCIKYWLKILRMDVQRLPYRSYRMLYELDAKGKRNWATKVKLKLVESGFDFVWINQGVEDISWFLRIFRERLIDLRWQSWNNHVETSNRFEFYNMFNPRHQIPVYITMRMDRHVKIIFTKFRFGISDLYIHSNRYKPGEQTTVLCPLCHSANEDEVHFMLCCPTLNQIRESFIAQKYWRRPCLFKLVLLLSSTNETVARNTALYVYHSFKLRSIAVS